MSTRTRGIAPGPILAFDRVAAARPAALAGADRETHARAIAAATSRYLQVFATSVALTIAVAWPVLIAPRTTMFGGEIVGRHPDPFLVMQQFEQGGATGIYRQPVTDDAGVLLSRAIGPVAAYNVVILASFPLAALAAYALAFYLTRVHRVALVAGLLFAFAPVHVAHAAYHPHIAQVQWIPLFLLALFAAIDRPTSARLCLLLGAAVGLVFSNFYGGLIGVVTTPVAAVAYWLTRPAPLRTWRGVAVAAGTLAIAAAAAYAFLRVARPDLVSVVWHQAFPIQDLTRYAARWQAYVLPPVDHALVGSFVLNVWQQLGVGPGLLEQQLYLGWGLIGLACVAIWRVLARQGGSTSRPVLMLIVIGAWTFIASLAPFDHAIHAIFPMFRSFARFGIVTFLCVAIVSALSVDWLLTQAGATHGWRRLSILSMTAILGALTLVEFAPLPWRARDVLPTMAHRWLANQTGVRVLDCTRVRAADASVPWLMGTVPLTLMSPPFDGCNDPLLPDKLAAFGYTHVIRRGMNGPPALPSSAQPALPVARLFPDSRVYVVPSSDRPVLTMEMQGFHAWEYQGGDRWRWMAQEGRWTVRNRRDREVQAILDVTLSAFARSRTVAVAVDGREMARLQVVPDLERYSIGPVTLPSGESHVSFRAVEPATRPNDVVKNGDDRYVTVMFQSWHWRLP